MHRRTAARPASRSIKSLRSAPVLIIPFASLRVSEPTRVRSIHPVVRHDDVPRPLRPFAEVLTRIPHAIDFRHYAYFVDPRNARTWLPCLRIFGWRRRRRKRRRRRNRERGGYIALWSGRERRTVVFRGLIVGKMIGLNDFYRRVRLNYIMYRCTIFINLKFLRQRLNNFRRSRIAYLIITSQKLSKIYMF